MFVDQSGTKLVFIDDKSDGYIYSPVCILHNSTVFPIESFHEIDFMRLFDETPVENVNDHVLLSCFSVT